MTTVPAGVTLIILMLVTGGIGFSRGHLREIWTLTGIALTVALLYLGGKVVFQQFPTRVIAGFLSLAGNQAGSNDMAAHPWPDPWAGICLWLGVIGLIALSYAIGNKFGKALDDKATFGTRFAGLIMGMLNGLFILLILFFDHDTAEPGFNVQVPNGLLTRTSVAPIIVFAIVAALIAMFFVKNAKDTKKA